MVKIHRDGVDRPRRAPSRVLVTERERAMPYARACRAHARTSGRRRGRGRGAAARRQRTAAAGAGTGRPAMGRCRRGCRSSRHRPPRSVSGGGTERGCARSMKWPGERGGRGPTGEARRSPDGDLGVGRTLQRLGPTGALEMTISKGGYMGTISANNPIEGTVGRAKIYGDLALPGPPRDPPY